MLVCGKVANVNLKLHLWFKTPIDSFWIGFWPASLAWGYCRHYNDIFSYQATSTTWPVMPLPTGRFATESCWIFITWVDLPNWTLMVPAKSIPCTIIRTQDINQDWDTPWQSMISMNRVAPWPNFLVLLVMPMSARKQCIGYKDGWWRNEPMEMFENFVPLRWSWFPSALTPTILAQFADGQTFMSTEALPDAKIKWASLALLHDCRAAPFDLWSMGFLCARLC